MSASDAPKARRSSKLPDSVVPSVPPTIAFEEPSCLIATWHNILMIAWGTQATSRLVAELAEQLRQLSRAQERFSNIHMVVNNAPVPTSEARADLASLATLYDERLACLATMVEGGGFWASAMRSFITGMQLLERRHFKTKTCATPSEVASWLAPAHSNDTGVQVPTDELERVLLDLLARPSIVERH